MEKKKATTKSVEAAPKAKEVVKLDTAAVKETKAISKKFENGRIYINVSFNNTTISVTDEKGNVVAWSTAGALGFNGPKKATPFASSKVVATLAEKLRKSGPVNVWVYVNGVGGGRDSAIRSLVNHGFNILGIKDVTPIPHNGPRRAKVRRV